MTYVGAINAVLKLLRESQIASPGDTEYSLLIGEFANQTKREVEDAWNWNALRTKITVTTVNATSQYTIVGSGPSARFKTLDVYNATDDFFLSRKHQSRMRRDIALGNTGSPLYYSYVGQDSDSDTKVDLYTIPNGVYSIDFNLVVPQANFSTGIEVYNVPEFPVILGTYAKALSERGEDSGTTTDKAQTRYALALSDAIAIDNSNLEFEDNWFVD